MRNSWKNIGFGEYVSSAMTFDHKEDRHVPLYKISKELIEGPRVTIIKWHVRKFDHESGVYIHGCRKPSFALAKEAVDDDYAQYQQIKDEDRGYGV